MKIDDLSELEAQIDSDLAWRKKELTAIKLDVEASEEKSPSEQSRAIRTGIVLLYAHWEGAIKKLAEYYLWYVSGLHLNHCELKNNFLAIEIKGSLDKLVETKKATLYNQLIADICAKKNDISNIPVKDIIRTDSNLKMETFQQVMSTIGLEDSSYILKKVLINERLLYNRNKIAHGERIEKLYGISTPSEYLELHDEIFLLINKFANDIRKAAEEEFYKI